MTDRDRKRSEEDKPGSEHESEGLSGMPEMIRRFAALGLSGFFTTESALRRALGDTVPPDWVRFAAEQGERTREELLDRFAAEMGRILERVDISEVLDALLAGRTLEVSAQIRLGKRTEDVAAPKPAGREQAARRRSRKLGSDPLAASPEDGGEEEESGASVDIRVANE